MLNTKIVMDLDKKLNNIKTISKKEVYKKEVSKNDTEVKSDFKDYLSKEVKSDTSKNSINSMYVQENDKTSISNEGISKSQNETEDILLEVSNKLEELIDSEYFLGNGSELNALSEILVLLFSLLNTYLSSEELIDINNDFSSSNNFSDLNNFDLDNIENLFLTLFNSKDDIKTENPLSNLELLRTNSSDDIDIKGLLKDVKELTDNILEDINLNLSDTNTIDNYKSELSEKIIYLLESLPKESIEKISSNIKDEDKLKILIALLLQKVSNEDNSIEKSTSNLNIDVNDDFVDNNVTSLDKDITKEKNLNDNNSLKQNSLDENNDEDIILSKIIDSDNKGSFSKVLTYYDKFNKNNVETIKEPVTVNRQTIDLDIIKNVKFMMKNSVQELKVKVYPKELGEMTIKILSEEGIMRAEIKATSKETYNLLNSNLNDIKKSLVDQNIKIQEVNIGIYNEDTTFFSGKENSSDNYKNQKSNENRNNSILIEDEEVKEDLLNESNVNLLA
ncbi:MAG: flagellar hook-length control protein FliK [Clostridium sp.]|uniref:flagellar hook-length control protein FliK n=1 Tax=Clostridium sp. TaxID=1506 RepID=UPI001ECE5D87|nr:flagellar hook-length control protein FliK [Clostridium sp.]MBS5883233.1 flagellar hook-length control protein FliK [Clostridium sp.]MDU7146860.1 flagellar hook-length control protein FliK [Clostridium sp.]MDU7239958.1 flagellar hook-length control protein FliK [Clostridium sp.]